MSIDDKTAKIHNHAHHFESSDHEYVTSKQGIWLFLSTEILMFGVLFVGYIFFKGQYPEMFKVASKHLSWQYGAINTIVLLFSSFTMALSIYYIQKGRNKTAINALLITIICGAIFMCIKFVEYKHKFHLGLYPGTMFSGDLEGFANLPLYFSFYFMMSGLHGFHVLIGMGLIAWVLFRTKRGDFSPKYYTAVEGVGLFWHVVDLIWIFLFPLLYLVE